jgi:hypothetical protein
MRDSVWQVPKDCFVAVWNAAASLDEVSRRVGELAGGRVPRWAVLARAAMIRKQGVHLKVLKPAA